MTVALIVTLLLLVGLIGIIVWESLQHSVIDGLRLLVATPWGPATLADLGVAIVGIAVWICLLEPRPWARVAWVLMLCCFGNIATLVFLLSRWHRSPDLRSWLLGPDRGGVGRAEPGS